MIITYLFNTKYKQTDSPRFRLIAVIRLIRNDSVLSVSWSIFVPTAIRYICEFYFIFFPIQQFLDVAVSGIKVSNRVL